MRFIVTVVLVIALCFLGGLYLPWWTVAIIAFLVSLLTGLRTLWAFVAGFLGVFLLWGLLAFWIDQNNNGVLSSRIATLLPLGGSGLALIIVTAFVGGIVGGLASMTASFMRAPRVR